jgi:hypothetical protein
MENALSSIGTWQIGLRSNQANAADRYKVRRLICNVHKALPKDSQVAGWLQEKTHNLPFSQHNQAILSSHFPFKEILGPNILQISVECGGGMEWTFFTNTIVPALGADFAGSDPSHRPASRLYKRFQCLRHGFSPEPGQPSQSSTP